MKRFGIGVLFGLVLGLLALKLWFVSIGHDARHPGVVTYLRINAKPIEVQVELSTPCSPTGTHFYMGAEMRPVYVRMAHGLLDPSDSDFSVPGNKLILTGYWVDKTEDERAVMRLFDLYQWRVMIPYRTWNPDSSVNEGLTDPVEFKVPLNNKILPLASDGGGC